MGWDGIEKVRVGGGGMRWGEELKRGVEGDEGE